jgi:hypothetical protein
MHYRRGSSKLRFFEGQESREGNWSPSEGRVESKRGDSHDDMEWAPKDRLSKKASDPQPEDVWNLDKSQEGKDIVGQNSGWVPGTDSLTLDPIYTLPLPAG